MAKFSPLIHAWVAGDDRCGFSPTGEHRWMDFDDEFVRGIEFCRSCRAVRPDARLRARDQEAGTFSRVRVISIPDPMAGDPGHKPAAAVMFELVTDPTDQYRRVGGAAA